jgi:hypothetical protein
MDMENEFQQGICKDKYHEYIRLASGLPEEMKKRGVFEIEEFLSCPKNKRSLEKGVSEFRNTPVVFFSNGDIAKRDEFGVDPISTLDVEEVLKEFFFISPKSLRDVPQLYMSELKECISRVYAALYRFNFYFKE